MRVLWILLLLLSACTSVWERHQRQLAADEAQGDYRAAVIEAAWLVDNAFIHAPARERSETADATRYLRMAKLAVRAGNLKLAVEALREALTLDPHQAAQVRAELDHLPVGPAERERLQREFAWNSAALAPGDDARLEGQAVRPRCWSYRVREVRIRHRRTFKTEDGMTKQVTYDARPWAFDARSEQWTPEGDWVLDAGTEDELIIGPERPRYRALITAEHQFYADDTVPPCHRDAWHGPFESNGTVFVTAELPTAR